MNFANILNKYIELLGCNAKELSDASGISPTVISRYRNNERVPKYPSEQLDNVIKGIYKIADEKHIDITKDLKDEFLNSLNITIIDVNIFRQNFNLIISSLNINVADMSRFIGYDSSYLSKIRSGNRTPQNLIDFIDAISKYIISYYTDENSLKILASLISNDNVDLLQDKSIFKEKLIQWLSEESDFKENVEITENFLNKLDDFDLNEYIKAIHFDTLKVPTLPVSFPKSKNYFGLEGFKESQIDLLKTIALSKVKNEIYFYSNMSMIEASKDVEFTKRFMIGLAACLKKEIPIYMIHDLDRPFKELMLGLEGWLPLYMTGLITPHYLKNNANELFSHISATNGSAAISGYYTGNINNSVLYLTTKKDELKYYLTNAKQLWKKSIPLMDIYTTTNKIEFEKLQENDTENQGNRICICSNLPIYTLSEELLETILNRNNISTNDKVKIHNFLLKEKERIKEILKNSSISIEIPILCEEEFKKSNMSLSLSSIFYDKKVTYTYDDYLKHIELIKEYAENNSNFSFKKSTKNSFKNINIVIYMNKYVIISKENAPSIHFVIYHPTLINALEKFEIPLSDN